MDKLLSTRVAHISHSWNVSITAPIDQTTGLGARNAQYRSLSASLPQDEATRAEKTLLKAILTCQPRLCSQELSARSYFYKGRDRGTSSKNLLKVINSQFVIQTCELGLTPPPNPVLFHANPRDPGGRGGALRRKLGLEVRRGPRGFPVVATAFVSESHTSTQGQSSIPGRTSFRGDPRGEKLLSDFGWLPGPVTRGGLGAPRAPGAPRHPTPRTRVNSAGSQRPAMETLPERDPPGAGPNAA